MGNMNSGRKPSPAAKGLTSRYLAVDIRQWYQQKLLEPGTRFQFKWMNTAPMDISISIQVNDDHLRFHNLSVSNHYVWGDQDFRIDLSRSPCHFGGARPWFRCPVPDCNRQVAILYLDGTFACRKCLKLAYRSQRESEYRRAISQMNKIKSRLGWPTGLLAPCGVRPPGMHERTFMRLKALHDAKCLEALGKWSEHASALEDQIERADRALAKC